MLLMIFCLTTSACDFSTPRGLQAPTVEVFFAKQAAKTGIQSHSDGCNFILTAHLGLDVPEGKCWIKVGDEKREWKNGKAMAFDTHYYHETGESP